MSILELFEYNANRMFRFVAALMWGVVGLCTVLQESNDSVSDKICEAVEQITSADKYVYPDLTLCPLT